MAKVKFDGIQEDLTAPNTPWIYYGVRNNKFPRSRLLKSNSRDPMPVLAPPTCEFYILIWFMEPLRLVVRILAILFFLTVFQLRHFLLAVTHAALSNWEYMEVIRQAADPKCSHHLEKSIETIDSLLNYPSTASKIKGLFGLKDLKHDEDFVSLLEVFILCFSSILYQLTLNQRVRWVLGKNEYGTRLTTVMLLMSSVRL
jgi:hypothetical protein